MGGPHMTTMRVKMKMTKIESLNRGRELTRQQGNHQQRRYHS